MKKSHPLKYALFVFVIVFAIKASAQTTHIPEELLIGCWTDSREENVAGSGIGMYRHCDYKKFPASRFRFKMDLKANGKCTYLQLASNDAHHRANGTWTFDREKSLLEVKDDKGQTVQEFRLLGLREGLMEIEIR